MLNQNNDMIEVMENDLIAKIQVAIDCNADLKMNVYGVFNIDDLERKQASDLGAQVGVGVSYVGARKTEGNTPGVPAKQVQFAFSVILAVPAGELSDERHPATKLLTVLRRAILGKPIAGDRVQRCWDYVSETPEPSASTATMLYYAQLWQVAMPITGVPA